MPIVPLITPVVRLGYCARIGFGEDSDEVQREAAVEDRALSASTHEVNEIMMIIKRSEIRIECRAEKRWFRNRK